MEPAVRKTRAESAIVADRKRTAPFDSQGLPIFPGCRTVLAVETLPRGTEFLDTETGGCNRPERPQVSPETERAERYRRKSPQKRPIQSRCRDLWFGGTGWWRRKGP